MAIQTPVEVVAITIASSSKTSNRVTFPIKVLYFPLDVGLGSFRAYSSQIAHSSYRKLSWESLPTFKNVVCDLIMDITGTRRLGADCWNDRCILACWNNSCVLACCSDSIFREYLLSRANTSLGLKNANTHGLTR
jgi:hypothetical protein